MRTLCIGDTHGGYKAVVDVLRKAVYNPLEDSLIFLGDYADGWSETPELIDYLLELEGSSPLPIIFLRGNHDLWLEEYLDKRIAPTVWLKNGGQVTKDRYDKLDEATKQKHLKFLRGLHNYYIDDKNRGFVHAGYESHKGLGHEAFQRVYYWSRELWYRALNTAAIKKSLTLGHTEVFIGHTTTQMWDVKPHLKEYHNPDQPKNGGIIVPMERCGIWNLDTGGGWGGKITAMDIDTKQYFQSDYVKSYYPEEKGR